MKIRHEPQRKRFVAELGDAEGVLDYARIDEHTLNYRRTFVPPEHRGRGIAGRLVRFALDYAEGNGLKVVPTCSFVASFIRDNPRYAALVAE